jgi:hypothetical protein
LNILTSNHRHQDDPRQVFIDDHKLHNLDLY